MIFWLYAMQFNSSRRIEACIFKFLPIFKIIDVCRNDTGEYMKNYTEENDLLKKPQRMLISSFKLEILTPPLRFCLSLGLQCTKIYRSVDTTCTTDYSPVHELPAILPPSKLLLSLSLRAVMSLVNPWRAALQSPSSTLDSGTLSPRSTRETTMFVANMARELIMCQHDAPPITLSRRIE